MNTLRALVLSAALAALSVGLVPTASADTCASAIAEEVVCPPVLAAYCTLYAVIEKYPVLDCALRAIPGPIVLP